MAKTISPAARALRPGVPRMRPGPASSVCRCAAGACAPGGNPFPETRSAPLRAGAFLALCAAWTQRPFLSKNQKAAQPLRFSANLLPTQQRPHPRAEAARSLGGRHQKPAGAKLPHCAQATLPMGAVLCLQPLRGRAKQRPPRGRAGFLFFQLNISAACSRPASVTSSAPSWPGWVSSTAQRISGCCRAR